MAYKHNHHSYTPRNMTVATDVRVHAYEGKTGGGYAGSYDEAFGPPSPRSLVSCFTADMEEPLIPDLLVDAWLLIYHDRGQGHE